MKRIMLAAVAAGLACAAAADGPAWDYRVEYIDIPTKGYVDTGHVLTGAPKVTTKLASLPESGVIDLFGTKTAQDGCIILNFTPPYLTLRYGKKSHNGNVGTLEAYKPYEIVCDSSLVVDGNTLQTVTPGTFGGISETVCFPGQRYAKGLRVYGFKLEDGSYCCDLIPCVKDGVPKFYDAVSGNFLSVSGATPTAHGLLADDGSALPALTVDNSAPTTMSAWMSANGVTDLSDYGEIRYAGTAEITNTTELSGWNGIVRIKSGAVLVAAHSDALGTAIGPTHVEDGGTLEIWGAAAGATKLVNEVVTCIGQGVALPGGSYRGALYNTYEVSNESGNSVWPHEITFLGDTYIRVKNNKLQDFNSGTYYWDMNGYDVTFRSGGTYNRMSLLHITRPGNVTVTGVGVNFAGMINGDASNTLTIGDGSSDTCCWLPNVASNTTGARTGWTLVMKEKTYFSVGMTPANTYSYWLGPVQLNDMHRLWLQTPPRFCGLALCGPVSGEQGGFRSYPSNNRMGFMLMLMNPNNSFKRGVSMSDGCFTATANGALPADGGALVMTNGAITLSGDIDYALPDCILSATGKVSTTTATGAWKKLSKTGSGEWIYDSRVGADVLELSQGGVHLTGEGATAPLPVFTNVTVAAGAWLRFDDGFDGVLDVPNLGASGIISNGNVRVTEKLTVDPAVVLAGGRLQVSDGALTFAEGAKFDFASGSNLASLDKSTIYTVATAADGVSGRVAASGAAKEGHWLLAVQNGAVSLFYASGMTITFR